MKKQYRLATFALSACLLMACGARETNAPENNEAEKQTENISNIDTKIDETETSGALTESESRETPIAPKEIAIDFTGVSEFHPEGTAAQPYSLEILSETYNNITFADEWYNATEDVSLPMIGENWDCFYDENYTYQWDDGKLSIFDGENCLYVLEYPTDKWYVNGNNACIENGIFYGASVMNGYAQPDTCFMFAYDLENEKLLWRSADQTYNSMNFLVKGDVIFCGYGFTAEDDYLYQLDKNTGEVIDRLPLKKMPDLMAEKDGRLDQGARKPGSIMQLLEALRQCELKNDALLYSLYEYIGERYQPGYPYAVYLFFGSYDVPTKGKDKENQWESEEVYQFLIGTISPVTGDYEAGKPEAGFLYPAFANHSTDIDGINIYQAEEGAQLFAKILGVQA